ncbi:MAG TPA: hypothetical protein VIU64_21940 [Polyangia bacterium]
MISSPLVALSLAFAAIAPPRVPEPGAPAAPAAVAVPAPVVASAQAALSLTLTPERRSLTLGVDTETRIAVSLVGAGAEASQAVATHLEATVGTLGPLVPGPEAGTFSATYRVPGDRRPQAALISVEVLLPSGGRAHGTTVIELPARTTFPMRTDPFASVTLNVAGRDFGPVGADGKGQVSIPIVVPPGVEAGQARAQARFGGAKEMQVDLQTRDYPRVLVRGPAEAETGDVIEVEVWAIDADAGPAAPEDIDLRVSAGVVRRREGGSGVARFAVVLPCDLAASPVTLEASMNDGSSERAQKVALHPGRPATLLLSSSRQRLVVGSAEVAEIEVGAVDRCENDVDVAGVSLALDDLPLPVVPPASGEVVAHARVSAPPAWPGRERTTVVARLGALMGRREILLQGGAPARMRVEATPASVPGDGRTAVDLVAQVVDGKGTPTITGHIGWSTPDEGELVALPSPRVGSYAARFTPTPSLRDREVVVRVLVDGDVSAAGRFTVETAATRNASVRVGMISDLRGLFGQSALAEASVPLTRARGYGRLVSVGLSAGYIHSEATSTALMTTVLRTNLNQFPLLAFVRARLPLRLPVEVALSALGGATWTIGEIMDMTNSGGLSRGSAVGAAVGSGVDVAFPLRPGELVFGARYFWLTASRLSNGDALGGNLGGLLLDVGFRVRL